MPFYTLSCTKCGHVFEGNFSISDRENKRILCPSCRSNELTRCYDAMHLQVGRPQAEPAPCPGAAGGVCPHSGGRCPHAK